MHELRKAVRRGLYRMWFVALRRVALGGGPPQTVRPSWARSGKESFCGASSPESPGALAAQWRALAEVGEGRRRER